MKLPIQERIHQIIDGHSGIKASRLCAHLSTEYLELTKVEIKKTIITMIHSGELYEIEYTLPGYISESLLLPRGSEVKGISGIEDLGEITVD